MGDTPQIEPFEEWAIVDLFGHQRIAGKVTTQNLGSATFVRVDVYKNGKVAFTRFFNPAAIYGIAPVGKAEAIAVAASCDPDPVKAYELERRALPGRLYEDT